MSQIQIVPRYLCILDFEATCWKENNNHEVIEFPTVVIDVQEKKILDDTFQVYVKPSVNPTVSSFCLELTGITQETVNHGISFPNALKCHSAFIDQYRPFIFVTCGDWDLDTMMSIECKIHNLNIPAPYRKWINIKTAFAETYKLYKSGGMPQMLSYLGLELHGRHHSGIDDCGNIARIALQMIKDGWTPNGVNP